MENYILEKLNFSDTRYIDQIYFNEITEEYILEIYDIDETQPEREILKFMTKEELVHFLEENTRQTEKEIIKIVDSATRKKKIFNEIGERVLASSLVMGISGLSYAATTSSSSMTATESSVIREETVSDNKIKKITANYNYSNKGEKNSFNEKISNENNDSYNGYIGYASAGIEYESENIRGYDDRKNNRVILREENITDRSQSATRNYINTRNNRKNTGNKWFYTTLKDGNNGYNPDYGGSNTITNTPQNVLDKYRELAVVIPEKTDSAITADERIADDPYNGYIRNFDVEKVTSELQKETEMAVTNPETEQVIRNYNVNKPFNKIDIGNYPSSAYNIETGISNQELFTYDAVDNSKDNNILYITNDKNNTVYYTKIFNYAQLTDTSNGSIMWLATPNQGSSSSSMDIFENAGFPSIINFEGTNGTVVYLTENIIDVNNKTLSNGYTGGNFAFVNSYGRIILNGQSNTLVVADNPGAKLYLNDNINGSTFGNDIIISGKDNIGFLVSKPITIDNEYGSGYIKIEGENGIFAYVDDKTSGSSEMKNINFEITGDNNNGIIIKNGNLKISDGQIYANPYTSSDPVDVFHVSENGKLITNSPIEGTHKTRVLTVSGSNAHSTMYDNRITINGTDGSVGAIILNNNNTRFFNTTMNLNVASGVYMRNSTMSRSTVDSPTSSPIDLILSGKVGYNIDEDNGYFMYLDNSSAYANISEGSPDVSHIQENKGFILKNNSSLDLGGMEAHVTNGGVFFDIDGTSKVNIINTLNPLKINVSGGSVYRIKGRELDLRNGLPNIKNANLIQIYLEKKSSLMKGYFVDTRLSYLNPDTFKNSGNAPEIDFIWLQDIDKESTAAAIIPEPHAVPLALLEVSNLLLDETVNLDDKFGTINHIRIYNSSIVNNVGNSIIGTKDSQKGIVMNYYNVEYDDIGFYHGPNYEYSSSDVLAYDKIINNGNIKLTGNNTYGMLVTNGDAINTGNITVGSNNSYGMLGYGSISELLNKGNISVGNNSTGMYMENTAGTNTVFENTGAISLNGTGSIGMYSKDINNRAINKGDININTAYTSSNGSYIPPSIGIYQNGINDGNINGGEYAVGMFGDNLTVTGSSKITLGNNSTGIYLTSGNFDANGEINTGTNSVGIYNKASYSNININLDNFSVGRDSFGIVNDGTSNTVVNINKNVTLTDNSVLSSSKSNNMNLTVNNNSVLGTSGSMNRVIHGGGIANNNGTIDLSQGVDNIGMYSRYGGEMFNTKSGKIVIGERSIGMYTLDGKITNDGLIEVNGKNSIGMYSEGREAINNGEINLSGDNSIGIYGNNGAKIINNGIIKTTGNGKQIVGILLDNNSELLNSGNIHIDSEGGYGTFRMNGSVIKNYGTISVGNRTRLNEIDDSKSEYYGQGSVSSPVVTLPIGGSTSDRNDTNTVAEYIDTSNINFTRPIENLGSAGIINSDLLIGSEASSGTNEKEMVVAPSIYDPFNQEIRKNQGIIDYDLYSGSLTFKAEVEYNSDKTINSLKLIKKDYREFHDEKNDSDGSTYGVLSGLEERYGMNDINSEEKRFFNKLNSIGNNELEVLTQSVDQIKGNIYSTKDKRQYDLVQILDREFEVLEGWYKDETQKNRIKTFTSMKKYDSGSNGIDSYKTNTYGIAYVKEEGISTENLKRGWYAGLLYNKTTFKDLMNSEQEDFLGKVGIYNTFSLNKDDSLRLRSDLGLFISKSDIVRRMFIVDEVAENTARYSSYGIDISNKLIKEIKLTPSTNFIVSGGVDIMLGKAKGFTEDGVFRLESNSNTFTSIRPNIYLGTETEKKYANYTLKGEIGIEYNTEIGKLNKTKLKLADTQTEYYTLRGEKKDRNNLIIKGSVDLSKNERIGFNLNTGYNFTDKEIRIGLGIRATY